MKAEQIRLFIKPYCGWCHEAMDWLNERGIKYEVLDVMADARARNEMLELSGQTLAPVIDVDGESVCCRASDEVCPDCGYAAVTELTEFQRMRPSTLLGMLRYW